MKEREEITVDIEVAEKIAREIVSTFENVDIGDVLTVLNALTVAMMSVATSASKECYANTDDAVTKLVLEWMRSCDPHSGLNFGRYINLPVDSNYNYSKNDIVS